MMAKVEFLEWLVQQAANHLWQSTAFAAAAFLIAVALRSTHARARHWVWLAASLKFLVPFGVLASVGGAIGSWLVPTAQIARIPFTVEQAVQPFALPPQQAVPTVATPAAGPAGFPVAVALLAVWLIGFAAVLFHWWNRWRHVRAAVRASAPVREGREADALRRLGSDVELVSSDAKLEPGTFGILRPVLWLPAGIADRLSEAELDAILAHELCHLRHRDNLWAAIHMVVEAIFWFHPLVWWLGARLIEERERACDEEVVRLGSEPQAYAEGVLKVCEFYLESPLPCAAGVTGADLKKRIEGIMESRFINELCFWKKLVLTALLAAVVACPLLLGVFKAEAQVASPARIQPGDQSPRSDQAVNPVPAQASQKEPIGPPPSSAVRAGLPKFEVASVKRTDQCALDRSIDPRSVTLRGVPLKPLLMEAFKVRMDQIEGPSWLETDCFDISAKIPEGGSLGQLPAMLQALLTERFKLAAHKEDRPRTGYALVVDKGGPKFKEDDPATNFMGRNAPPGLTLYGAFGHGRLKGVMTMAKLVANLSRQGYGQVEDHTGLTGNYDIDLTWTPDPAFAPKGPTASAATPPSADNPAAPEGPSLFAAVREQLGLKLEKRQVQFQYVVIDRIERIPTEN